MLKTIWPLISQHYSPSSHCRISLRKTPTNFVIVFTTADLYSSTKFLEQTLRIQHGRALFQFPFSQAFRYAVMVEEAASTTRSGIFLPSFSYLLRFIYFPVGSWSFFLSLLNTDARNFPKCKKHFSPKHKFRQADIQKNAISKHYEKIFEQGSR